MKKIKWFLLLGLILISLVTWIANRRIEKVSKDLVYKDVNSIPKNKVGLLLGTSKYLRSGELNQYFENRIQATVDLYNAKKIKKEMMEETLCILNDITGDRTWFLEEIEGIKKAQKSSGDFENLFN